MAFTKKSISPNVQSRLREIAAEMRGLLYGEAGCPEWGTKFTEIETNGMSVGLELARLVMEQSVDEQAQKMPETAMTVDDDVVIPTGTERQRLETEAGRVDWEQPRGFQKKSRKAFFPASPSIGADGR